MTLVVSCSPVQTLNLNTHYFNQDAKHIVWMQVAGLSFDHLALIKFSSSEERLTSLEKSQCVGKAWSYNLYELRPSAELSFLSQVYGSQNIKSQCGDSSKKPFWKLFTENGYRAGVLETLNSKKDQSLVDLQECSEQSNALEKLWVWRQRAFKKNDTSIKTYHYQEGFHLDKPGVYFDKSCQTGFCYTSLFEQVRSLWPKLSENQTRSFLLIRDFSYQKALKGKNISLAKEILLEFDRIYSFFQKMMEERKDVLVVLSSSAPKRFELPAQGVNWSKLEKNPNILLYRRTALISPVFASGAQSENFCGVFSESELAKRMIWKPEVNLFGEDGYLRLPF